MHNLSFIPIQLEMVMHDLTQKKVQPLCFVCLSMHVDACVCLCAHSSVHMCFYQSLYFPIGINIEIVSL